MMKSIYGPQAGTGNCICARKGCRVPPGCCVELLKTWHEGQRLTYPLSVSEVELAMALRGGEVIRSVH
eukprot:scaffold219536_cov19-Tisochrysis_lutea.AAC.1